MDHIQIGAVHVEAKGGGIAIVDDSRPGSEVVIPQDAVKDIADFLVFHAQSPNHTERRRSFRLDLEPGEVVATVKTGQRSIDVVALDISLGGMLVDADSDQDLPRVNDLCTVKLEVGGPARERLRADENCEIVRRFENKIALRFIDCDKGGEIIPTVDIAQICAELQRRWLAKRVQPRD